MSEIADYLRLFVDRGAVTELRAFGDGQAIHGTFDYDSLAVMAKCATELANCRGVYFLPNPISLEATNRLVNGGKCATDADVVRRRWVLVDIDPVRPKDSNATQAERDAAWRVAKNCHALLEALGWVAPVVASSGNGWHLCYPVDLANDEDQRDSIKALLAGLQERCGRHGANVDLKTYNASRIWKLYGTTPAKGAHTDDRPQRQSWVKDAPVPDDRVRAANNKALAKTLLLWRKQAEAYASIDSKPSPQAPTDAYRRAEACLAKTAPSISGQGGHDAAFHAAMLAVEGFGLSPEQAFAALQGWNSRCSPPWSERELRHKIDDALKACKNPGHMLSQPMPSPSASTAVVQYTGPQQVGDDGEIEDDATAVDLLSQNSAITWLWKGWIQKGTLTAIAAEPGVGKCFAKGTRILMHDGSVKCVEDIVPGDEVMGPDSLARTVVRLGRGREMMYRVSHRGGGSYVVNESHILSVKVSGLKRFRHHQVVNLPVGEYLGSTKAFREKAKGWMTGVDWPEKPVGVDPYILGVWLGDGESKHTTIHNPDAEVIKAIDDYCGENGLSIRQSGDGCPRVSVSGKAQKNTLLEGLRGYGLCPRKAIPAEYMANSRKVRLELLAGLLDTDGHMRNGGFEFSQKDGAIADSVCFIARSLGFRASIKREVKACQTGASGEYWRVSISGDCSVIPTRIKRKKAPPRRQVKDVTVFGLSVNPVGMGDYYGFELSGPDRLFLLDDFTVVHNTRLCADLLRRMVNGIEWPDGQAMTVEAGCKVIWVAADSQWAELATIPEQFGIAADSIVLNGTKANPYGGTNFDTIEDFARLERRIMRVKPACVYIDTIGNATDKEMTRPDQAKQIFKPLAEIANRTNTSIILVTHLNKDGQALGRRIVGAVRQVIKLECPDPEGAPNRRKLYIDKSNSMKPRPLGVTMGSDGNDYDGAPPAAASTEPGRGPGRPSNIEEDARWLEALLSDGNERQVKMIIDAASEQRGMTVDRCYKAKRFLGERVIESASGSRKFWRITP